MIGCHGFREEKVLLLGTRLQIGGKRYWRDYFMPMRAPRLVRNCSKVAEMEMGLCFQIYEKSNRVSQFNGSRKANSRLELV